MSVTVAIPAYDELQNLRFLLPELAQVKSAVTDFDLQVLVVVETDPDPDNVSELRAAGVSVVARAPSNSFGDAIRTAINTVRTSSDYIIFMDADGSHSPQRIPDLLSHAGEADIVIASRYVAGGTSDNGFILRAMSIALNRAYALILGIACKDVSTNFKLYRTADIRCLRLECANFDIVEEMVFGIVALKAPRPVRIIEIPDHFGLRRSGQTKRRLGVYIASYIWTLAKLRIRKRSRQREERELQGIRD